MDWDGPDWGMDFLPTSENFTDEDVNYSDETITWNQYKTEMKSETLCLEADIGLIELPIIL